MPENNPKPPQPAVKAKPAKVTRYRISSKDREYFIGNLALLLKAGVPVGEALQSQQEAASSRALKGAMQQMQDDIQDGLPLWKALERSGSVSTQTLALVQLGEQSGKLVENMRVAAKQEEKQRIFKSKVRSALIYPTFVLSVTAMVGLGVAWFLLPRLSVTFSQIGIKLPLISRIFIGFGNFLQHSGFWAVPLFVIMLIMAAYVLFAAPKTKWAGQQLLFHIPGVKKLMYQVEIARFGYLFGTLLEAGLSVTQALGLLGRATSAPNYQKFYAYLVKAFEDGYSFRNSLSKYKNSAKLLPSAVQQMIIAGERSGALPETLETIGTIYEEKADVTTANLEAVMEPILLVIVWVGVMAVAVAVILPIYSLVGGLNG